MTEDLKAWAKIHAPKIAKLDQGSKWEEADYLAKILPPEQFPIGTKLDSRPGLPAALDDHLYELAKELDTHMGVERKPKTLANHRATAIAWPPETRRLEDASYMVHYRIRGEDRFAEMEKHLRRAKREGVVLTQTRLSRYRQDEKPSKPLDPLIDRLDKRIGSSLKSLLLGGGRTVKRDDWWNSRHVSNEAKQDAIKALQAWAKRLRS